MDSQSARQSSTIRWESLRSLLLFYAYISSSIRRVTPPYLPADSALTCCFPKMAEALSADEKIALINENLQEVLKPEIIEDVIKKQNRPLVVYWGNARRNTRVIID